MNRTLCTIFFPFL